MGDSHKVVIEHSHKDEVYYTRFYADEDEAMSDFVEKRKEVKEGRWGAFRKVWIQTMKDGRDYSYECSYYYGRR